MTNIQHDRRTDGPAASDAKMNEALDRWDDEGGSPAPIFSPVLAERLAMLAAAERHILECLGAAVVIEWSDLPTDVQRAIFGHASASDQACETTEL